MDIVNGVVNVKALKFQENHAYGFVIYFGRIAHRHTEPEIDSVARLCPPYIIGETINVSFRAVDPKDGESGRRDTASDMW